MINFLDFFFPWEKKAVLDASEYGNSLLYHLSIKILNHLPNAVDKRVLIDLLGTGLIQTFNL